MASDERAAVLAHALECCKAHEPGVRLIGNVTAAQLLELLEHVVSDANMRVLEAMAKMTSEDIAHALIGARCFRNDTWSQQHVELYAAELARREWKR